jgi:hypothetical protein
MGAAEARKGRGCSFERGMVKRQSIHHNEKREPELQAIRSQPEARFCDLLCDECATLERTG